MKNIRMATEAEIELVRKGADLGGEPFQVWALENKQGDVDLAVVKSVIELDPVRYAASSNDIQKARFQWGIENRLAGMGVTRFGCRVHAADERWRKILLEWGFKQQSSEPEFQMMRNL